MDEVRRPHAHMSPRARAKRRCAPSRFGSSRLGLGRRALGVLAGLLVLAAGGARAAPAPETSTREVTRVTLPGGQVAAVALERSAGLPVPELQGRLELRSAGKTVWATEPLGLSLESLELVDMNLDRRYEVVAVWRGQGRGRHLHVEIYNMSAEGASLVFALPAWAYDGEAQLRGDLESGHVVLRVMDSLPTETFEPPFLRRKRQYYLDPAGKAQLLSESLATPATAAQHQTAALHWAEARQFRRALPHAQWLHEAWKDDPEKAPAAARLLARVLAALGMKAKAESLLQKR